MIGIWKSIFVLMHIDLHYSTAVDCGPPQISDNILTNYTTNTNTTSTLYGERISFVCSEGHGRSGQYWGEFVCREDGQWTLDGTDYVGEMSCICK